MNVKVDRAHWSEASKRSVAFDCKTFYADIHYQCIRCTVACVYSAHSQKVSFEQKKKYIDQRRSLCGPCNAELFRLRQQERAFQARWAAARRDLAKDAVFMNEWLGVLQAIPRYAPKYRNSMNLRLTTLLRRLARAGC